MGIYVFVGGLKKSLRQLAAESGVAYDTIYARWKNGVPADQLVELPEPEEPEEPLTKEEVVAALGYTPGRANPNLLDNWYFGNPVNQRGQTEYTATGYVIDRWLSRRAALRMVLNSDSITVSDTSNAAQGFIIDQRAETDLLDFLSGKKVTFSVLVKNAAGCIAQCGTDQIKIAGVGLFYQTCNFNKYSGENLLFRLYNNIAGGSADIIAVKMELGSEQTLAHQDSSGNWVLNEIPDYGEQLARCQRYFYAFDSGKKDIYFCAMGNATQIPGFLFPVPMRTAPGITIERLRVWDNRGFVDISGEINSKTARTGGLAYIELNGPLPNNGLIDLKASFTADL